MIMFPWREAHIPYLHLIASRFLCVKIKAKKPQMTDWLQWDILCDGCRSTCMKQVSEWFLHPWSSEQTVITTVSVPTCKTAGTIKSSFFLFYFFLANVIDMKNVTTIELEGFFRIYCYVRHPPLHSCFPSTPWFVVSVSDPRHPVLPLLTGAHTQTLTHTWPRLRSGWGNVAVLGM